MIPGGAGFLFRFHLCACGEDEFFFLIFYSVVISRSVDQWNIPYHICLSIYLFATFDHTRSSGGPGSEDVFVCPEGRMG